MIGAILSTAGAVEFDIEYHDSIPPEQRSTVESAFQAAADVWSSHLTDELTIKLEVRWVPTFENPNEGARATVFYFQRSFASIRDALRERASSEVDRKALEYLSTDPHLNFLMNKTSNSPHGTGSEVPYLDDNDSENNNTMRICLASGKLLGLLPDTLDYKDGRITISGLPNWDYDPSDGIAAGKADFHGLCLHEIGHVLGMNSMSDTKLGLSPGKAEDDYAFLTPLDLFRFSEESITLGGLGTPDWCSDGREKYFSVDGGERVFAQFSIGRFYDRFDPSHWRRDEIREGIFEPTVFPGIVISDLDLMAMDVIGWTLRDELDLEKVFADRNPVVEPEPEPEPAPEPELDTAPEPETEPVAETQPEPEPGPAFKNTPVNMKGMKMVGNRIRIEWDPVEGAGLYRVFICERLGGGFVLVPNGQTTGTSWEGLPAAHAECFFNVLAYPN